MTFTPDATYISSLLLQLQRELEGLHRKMDELERLRYGETYNMLPAGEKPTGLRVRTLMSSDLIESVKAAVTTNPPRLHAQPLRNGDAAQKNAEKREAFWNAHLTKMMGVYGDFVDAQVGLGISYLKAAYNPWPVDPRKQQTGETPRQYNQRQRVLKQQWGLPFATTTPHPMTMYPRYGIGSELAEVLEHGWRPKVEVYAAYSLESDADAARKAKSMTSLDTSAYDDARARMLIGTTGQPEELVRPLPYGQDTSTMCKVTEYWSKRVHQVWVDGRLLHEEEEPHSAYFYATGRSSSSKDPDKIGLSVAENLRFNEPIIDRALTRMAESAEILLKPPMAIEKSADAPAGAVIFGADNNPTSNTLRFTPGEATRLNVGERVVNPFEGVSNIYQAMPWLQQMIQLVSQHGVAPIFKGMPPGAAGSGYRDNSLYLMAKSMFNYLIDSLARAMTDYLMFMEKQLVAYGQEVWIGNLSLRPKDIDDFPCELEVKLDPVLPQNMIAEAELYMDAHAKGFGSRRWALEKGFKEERPEELMDERLLEQAEEMLASQIVQDAFRRVGIGAGMQPPDQGSGLVGPNGQPISSQPNPMAPPPPQGPGGVQQLLGPGGGSGGSGGAGGANGAPGQMRAGQSRQPPFAPGSFPPH